MLFGCYRPLNSFAGRRIFLHFEAVDSAFFTWVNGHPTGYRFVNHFVKTFLFHMILAINVHLLAYMFIFLLYVYDTHACTHTSTYTHMQINTFSINMFYKLFFLVLPVKIAGYQLNLRLPSFAIHVDLSREIVWLFK